MAFQNLIPGSLFTEDLDDDGRKLVHQLAHSINVALGGISVQIFLEAEDYALAIENAVRTFRRYSARSVNRKSMFWKLEGKKNVYVLPEGVDNVRKIWRSRSGLNYSSSLPGFNPYLATLYQNLFSGGNTSYDLTIYAFSMMYLEDLRKLFSFEIDFNYIVETRQLHLFYTPTIEEIVLLDVSIMKNITELLKDHWAYDWIYKYALAESKIILGNKLTVTTPMPGPQSGITVNGGDLKNEGNQEKEYLINEIFERGDSSEIAFPIIG